MDTNTESIKESIFDYIRHHVEELGMNLFGMAPSISTDFEITKVEARKVLAEYMKR